MDNNISNNNKRVATNTLILYFRMLLMMFINLFASRVVLQTLGASDYGLYNVVGGFVTLLGVFNTTLTTGTTRFLTYALGKGVKSEMRYTFSTIFWIHSVFSFLFFVILETVGLVFFINTLNIPIGREQAAIYVFHFSVLAACVKIIEVPFNSSIIAHENMKIYAYMSIYDAIMKLLIVFLLITASYDKLILYAFLLFIVNVSDQLLYIIYCRRNYEECKISKNFKCSVFSKIGSFVGWNALGVGGFVGSSQGVNIIINLFLGTTVNAARAISQQINSIVTQFLTSFLTAVNPQIIKYYAQNEISSMYKLMKSASLFGGILTLMISVPIALEIDFVLKLWLGDYPKYTEFFTQIVLLQAVITSASRPLVTAMHATTKIKYLNIFNGMSLLFIVPITYILLMLNYSIEVVMVINVLPWILEHVWHLIYVKKELKVCISEYFTEVYTKLLLLSILSISLGFILKNNLSDSFLSVLFVCFVSEFTLLFLAYKIAISKEMKSLILSKLEKYFNA